MLSTPALSLVALLAFAEDGPRPGAPLFIGAVTRGEAASPSLEAAVEQGLARSFLREGVLYPGSLDEAVASESAARLLETIEAARRAYLDVAFEKAYALVEDALALFETGPAYSSDERVWALYARALTLKALVLSRLERERERPTKRCFSSSPLVPTTSPIPPRRHPSSSRGSRR